MCFRSVVPSQKTYRVPLMLHQIMPIRNENMFKNYVFKPPLNPSICSLFNPSYSYRCVQTYANPYQGFYIQPIPNGQTLKGQFLRPRTMGQTNGSGRLQIHYKDYTTYSPNTVNTYHPYNPVFNGDKKMAINNEDETLTQRSVEENRARNYYDIDIRSSVI